MPASAFNVSVSNGYIKAYLDIFWYGWAQPVWPKGLEVIESAVHFGNLLRDMRDKRRMTRQRLADAAQLSEGALKQAESAEHCRLRRSNSIAVLEALERVEPLSPDEQEAFLDAADLRQIYQATKPLWDEARRQAAEDKRQEEAAQPAAAPTTEENTSRAFGLLHSLLAKHDSRTVVSMLESVAALAAAAVPAPQPAAAPARPRATVVTPSSEAPGRSAASGARKKK